jgi:hypothetical protein
MKRAILMAVLLFGTTLAARADNDTYVDNTRHGRGNDALHADVGLCAQTLGEPQNGQPTSRQFKQCMLGHGWKWKFTTVSRAPKPARNSANDDSWTFIGCTFNPSSGSDC